MNNLRLIIMIFFSLSTLYFFADILNVPQEYITIQAGINQATTGDTVLVRNGIYFEHIELPYHDITIASHYILTGDWEDVENTVLDAEYSGCAVRINNSDIVDLNGFTIRHGAIGSGAGIKCLNTDILSLRNMIIKDNSAAYDGGGVYFRYGDFLSIENCVFTGNFAELGGAIRLEGNGDITVVKSRFSNNVALNSAGAIKAYNAEIYNSVFIGNSSGANGGALVCNDSYIYNSLFVNNTAEISGAGIFCDDIYIYNSTLFGNYSETLGSAVSCDYSRIYNSILAYNSGEYTVYSNGTYNSVILRYSNCWANLGIETNSSNSDLGVIVTENANGTPCDMYFNIFQSPWFINPSINNYQLPPLSICIDAGNPDLEYEEDILQYDLAGNSRFSDGNDDGIVIVDMGAYEWQPVAYQEETISNSQLQISNLSNFPNPFNPSTTISFDISRKDEKNAKLEIYNIKGQRVESIPIFFDYSQDFSVVWNAEKFASGVYYYKLTTPDSPVKKMILLK